MHWALLLASMLAWVLLSPMSLAQAEATLPQRFLAIYVKMHDAEVLEKNADYAGALKGFEDCQDGFEAIRQSDPDWEPAVIGHRLNDVRVTIKRLQDEIADSSGKASAPDTVSATTGTNTVSNTPLKTSALLQKQRLVYPWKERILTTIFWIGEKSTDSSAWNANWIASNHGEDDPGHRNGYASGKHASSVNPFYVALPFNDLAFPTKARQWVPASWQRTAKDGKPVSACQHRWVEIKAEDKRVCYAQWEDVGPSGGDHAEYVFGSERPAPGHAGLDISPAVAQYLGWDNKDSHGQTKWRFVDADDVPPGQWLKLDEQAVIYTAMHQ